MVLDHIYDFGCSTFIKKMGTNGNHPIFADGTVYHCFIVSEVFPIPFFKPKRVSGNAKSGKIYDGGCDGKPGDYIEFYAEIDLLVAVSVCPSGDGLVSGTMPEKVVLRPIGIEMYETGVQPKEFPKWTDWRPTWKGKWTPS